MVIHINYIPSLGSSESHAHTRDASTPDTLTPTMDGKEGEVIRMKRCQKLETEYGAIVIVLCWNGNWDSD